MATPKLPTKKGRIHNQERWHIPRECSSTPSKLPRKLASGLRWRTPHTNGVWSAPTLKPKLLIQLEMSSITSDQPANHQTRLDKWTLHGLCTALPVTIRRLRPTTMLLLRMRLTRQHTKHTLMPFQQIHQQLSSVTQSNHGHFLHSKGINSMRALPTQQRQPLTTAKILAIQGGVHSKISLPRRHTLPLTVMIIP